MAKKIPTIPFGAEVPPDIAAAFDQLVDTEGWTKKRTLAAAIRAFIAASPADRHHWYRHAYADFAQGADAESSAKRGRGTHGVAARKPDPKRRKSTAE